MPPEIAYVLDNRNDGGLQFMLHAEPEHGGAGSLVRCVPEDPRRPDRQEGTPD